MKAYGEVDVQMDILLTLALAGGEWSASRPGRFTPGQRAPGAHWIGGWVDLRAGLDDLEKRKFLTLLGLELRPLGRPARSQSLYRLRYAKQVVHIKVTTVPEKLKSDDHGCWPGNRFRKRRGVSIAPVGSDRNSKYS
jgi:hypothetical protein